MGMAQLLAYPVREYTPRPDACICVHTRNSTVRSTLARVLRNGVRAFCFMRADAQDNEARAYAEENLPGGARARAFRVDLRKLRPSADYAGGENPVREFADVRDLARALRMADLRAQVPTRFDLYECDIAPEFQFEADAQLGGHVDVRVLLGYAGAEIVPPGAARLTDRDIEVRCALRHIVKLEGAQAYGKPRTLCYDGEMMALNGGFPDP